MAIQHRVLFWGILGAVVLRGVMIAAGAALIHRFEWIVYVFGLLLIASAIKLMITESKHIDPEKNLAIRLTRRFYPVSRHFDGSHFFTKLPGTHSVPGAKLRRDACAAPRSSCW